MQRGTFGAERPGAGSQVQCSKISVAFGDRDILDNVSILLGSGGETSGSAKVPATRAALAGINGSGKTTLMHIIAGLKEPDSGERSASPNCRVSYLPQSGLVFAGRSLREEVETAWQSIADLLVSMEELGKRLEQKSRDDTSTRLLVEEHHALAQAVEDSGYYRRDETAAHVLSGLGFSRSDYGRDCAEFSGGWQMRIALAKVLLENPGIMLLDEPTNYLDIEARTWLENHLKRFNGGYLLVSHDRYFLDTTVNEVYEIFQGRLKRYAGNYSDYEKIRQQELESLIKRYDEQQEEIVKSQALIDRFRYKASKAAMVQERIKKLEKMEKIVIPESLKKISISFPPPPHSGRIALTLEQIEKSYEERKVLSGLDLTIESGERLVVVGKNGAGKTTLLRIIAGADNNFKGNMSYGAGIALGYFSQDSAEQLNGNETILELLEAEAPTALIPKVRNMLGAFLFRGDDVYKALRVLSGGEKSRLALLRLLLRPVNLLVLDEPTNHLDIHSKDVLLEALQAFTGTVIFVSHDRSFMEALSTKTLELRQPEIEDERKSYPSAARLFYGNYAYYLEREQGGALPPPNVAETADADAGGKKSAPPFSAAAQREQAKQRETEERRQERREKELFAALEKLEAEKAVLEAELAKPEVYSNGEKAKAVKRELDKKTGELEAKTMEWENL
jgi:ATP-binding cassette subfamily F protein 3